jgi:hypothetical protein
MYLSERGQPHRLAAIVEAGKRLRELDNAIASGEGVTAGIYQPRRRSVFSAFALRIGTIRCSAPSNGCAVG